MRGETTSLTFNSCAVSFQSTPLMRGETAYKVFQRYHNYISIHSPHARGDLDNMLGLLVDDISIHSPHARGDGGLHASWAFKIHFNPLPSCEGRPATKPQPISQYHFNPLPSCEGRPVVKRIMRYELQISIHSPHARGDNLAQSEYH